MESIRTLVVAGGGTGGHLFPGLAIAREFRRRDPDVRVLYIGVEGKMEAEIIPAAGMEFHGLKVRGLKGMASSAKLASALLAVKAVAECRRLLSSCRPELVVGVGGYSSGPAALAAWTLKIPLVLQEQNTVPGLTNRLLGRLAEKVFLAFEEAAPFFPAGRTSVTGNPLREEALGAEREIGEGPPVNLLVLGGSRGAESVNRLLVAALSLLAAGKTRLSIRHQSGREDREWVEKAYREAGLEAEVEAFIERPGEAYSWADLVVSRAGAGAVAEIAANGRPAILVPFPHSAGDHQMKNARWLFERGGAVVVEEEGATAEDLAATVESLVSRRDRLREMAAGSRRAGRRDAAGRIVSECYRLLGVQGR
jgi:UDP-N-acetylglucosamine--N-acetylmuramyl-(pentapeptide) pyrophosphoryl-undecaprenol N-acetylglucosamine transferase